MFFQYKFVFVTEVEDLREVRLGQWKSVGLALLPVKLHPLAGIGTHVDDGDPGLDRILAGSFRSDQVDDSTPERVIILLPDEILKSVKITATLFPLLEPLKIWMQVKNTERFIISVTALNLVTTFFLIKTNNNSLI